MPLPLLFIGIAVATGAVGIGKTTMAGFDQHKASKLNENSNKRMEEAATRLNTYRRQCEASLEALGNEKLFVLCGKIRREAAERLEVLYGGGAGAEDAVSGVCDFLENSIDDILGGGAAAEIFGAREMTVIPLTDLLVYIVENNLLQMLESYQLIHHPTP